MTSDLGSDPLRAVLDRIGDDHPTPGGGVAAALGGALGTALVAMLARVSVAQGERADHAKLLNAVAEEADTLRERLLALADEDAAAYAAVTKAAPEVVEAALKEATEVPLRIMEACVEAVGLAKNAVERGFPSAIADGAAGAELCRAGLRGAAALVQANLKVLRDEEFKGHARTRMDEMLYMGTRVATSVESFVEDLWK